MFYLTSLTLLKFVEHRSIIPPCCQQSPQRRDKIYLYWDTTHTIIKISFYFSDTWSQADNWPWSLCHTCADQMTWQPLPSIIHSPLTRHGCAEIRGSFVRVCPISVPLLCSVEAPGGGQVMKQIRKQLQNNLLSRISWLWHIISPILYPIYVTWKAEMRHLSFKNTKWKYLDMAVEIVGGR